MNAQKRLDEINRAKKTVNSESDRKIKIKEDSINLLDKKIERLESEISEIERSINVDLDGLDEEQENLLGCTDDLTAQDISVLKYYKEGKDLCGFEGVHSNLSSLGYLDYDLRLTSKGKNFINNFEHLGDFDTYNNKTRITIK